MTDLDKQYWKIKDFADHFGLDKSTVYNQIERGEIRAIRIGKTALRIPTDEVKRILDSFVAPNEQPHHLYRQVRDFEVRTCRTPAEFTAAWREGKIEDTPHNASDAIEALALREAMQPTVTAPRPGEDLPLAAPSKTANRTPGPSRRIVGH